MAFQPDPKMPFTRLASPKRARYPILTALVMFCWLLWIMIFGFFILSKVVVFFIQFGFFFLSMGQVLHAPIFCPISRF